MQANTIDEVIKYLDSIINESIQKESPLGYFAALYRKVTVSVKDKLGTGYFEDDARMEYLDIVFANRYLAAYTTYQDGGSPTYSWAKAFELTQNNHLIVLQHLLLGINAHISLDLGIAAAAITNSETISDLQTDFNKINDLLQSLVASVEQELAQIWPTLLWILKYTKGIDDFLIRFSMKIARNGAWRFANKLAGKEEEVRSKLIRARDQQVANISNLILPKGMIEKGLFWIIRKGERGTISERIQILS